MGRQIIPAGKPATCDLLHKSPTMTNPALTRHGNDYAGRENHVPTPSDWRTAQAQLGYHGPKTHAMPEVQSCDIQSKRENSMFSALGNNQGNRLEARTSQVAADGAPQTAPPSLGVVALSRDAGQPYCFDPTVNSPSLDGSGAGAGLCLSFFCGPLASTLDERSVGFSTRRDDPSN